MKEINLSSSVYELVTTYPEIQTVLFDLGLKDIQNPAMLTTVGRYMTIPKGAKMKKVDLHLIIDQLEQLGFTIKE